MRGIEKKSEIKEKKGIMGDNVCRYERNHSQLNASRCFPLVLLQSSLKQSQFSLDAVLLLSEKVS